MSASPRPPIPSPNSKIGAVHAGSARWLNGLFAGLFGLSETVAPVSSADAAKLLGIV